MTIKAEWKKVLNNNDFGKLAVEKKYVEGISDDDDEQSLEDGTLCIVAGTYVEDDTNEVKIGYLPGAWYKNDFIIPDDFYNSFRPLYWDFLNIENPIELKISE